MSRRRPQQLSMNFRGFTSMFDAARGDQFNLDWTTFPISINQAVWQSLPQMRARSRDMGRNSPYYTRYIESTKQNVAGARGVRFQNRAKGPDNQLLTELNRSIEQAYADWSRKGNFDVTGQLSRAAAERLFVATLRRDGEVLVMRWRGQPNRFGLSVQFIDVERLDRELNTTNFETGNQIVMGVELTPLGRPVTYWFKPFLETTSQFLEPAVIAPGRERIPVPAEDILHSYHVQEPEQVRGYPDGIAAILTLKDLDGYREAAVLAARDGANTPRGVKSGSGESDIETERTPLGERMRDSQPGDWPELGEDDEIIRLDSSYPHGEYKDFNRTTLRGAAAALGMNYSTLAQDYEGVNLSSIRFAGLDERDAWRMLQQDLITDFCDPVFRWWATDAAALGAIPGVSLSNLEQVILPAWLPRSWPSPEPLKDAQADELRRKNNQRADSQIMEEMGHDPEETWERIAADQALQEQLGIRNEQPSDAETTTNAETSNDSPEDDSDGDSVSDRNLRAV